jgi:hypothetical protein
MLERGIVQVRKRGGAAMAVPPAVALVLPGTGVERCDRCHRIGLAAGWRGPTAGQTRLKIPAGMPLVLRHDLIGHPRLRRG